jgi:hypothetical protein
MTDAEASRVLEYFRAALISGFYFVSCLMLGTGSGKAACLGIGLFAFQVIPIGRRRIEQLAVVFFLAACLVWMGLIPIGMKHFEFAIELGKAPISVSESGVQ